MQAVSVLPLSQKDSYNTLDTIDFYVAGKAGMAIRANSMRLTGFIEIASDAAYNREGSCIALSPHAGAHALFRSWSSTVGGRLVEALQYYPRVVAMETQASKSLVNSCTTASDVVEAKTATPAMSNDLILASVSQTAGTYRVEFSITPMIAPNSTVADLPYSKIMDVRLTTQLAAASECIFSGVSDAPAGGYSYVVKGLKLSWFEVPETKADMPLVMQVKTLIKQRVDTSINSVSVSSPLPVNSLAASFIQEAHLNNADYDNQGQEALTGLSRVELQLFDGDALYKYPLLSTNEILFNYLSSLSNTDKNALSPFRLDNADYIYSDVGTGVGFNLMSNIPNPKINLTLYSAASSGTPFAMFLYLFSNVQL